MTVQTGIATQSHKLSSAVRLKKANHILGTRSVPLRPCRITGGSSGRSAVRRSLWSHTPYSKQVPLRRTH